MPDGTDAGLFDLVNRYVEADVAQRAQLRHKLLAGHAELAGLLDCLDTLDSMAAASGADMSARAGAVDSSATAAWTEAGLDAAAGVGSTPQEATAGRQFGKYALIAELGRGGMGVVYHARQEDLDRSVALKMILSSHLASADEVRRFYDEARAAGSLHHPGIVAIHEVGQIHGQHYFTMDYIDGRSLEDVLRAGPLDPETAATYLLSVARAVDYLHAHGFVHRDLKPSNILLDQECRPYVADFGLAKAFSTSGTHTATGTVVGTPPYMSPEQAAGETKDVSQRSDIYSLGALLYTMLTGHPPVEEGNLLDMLMQVREREPVPPCRIDRRIPRPLERICLRCLEKRPQNRYPSAAALARDLDRFLQGEPVAARAAGIVHWLSRWTRRQPVLVSHLGGLLVAATIVQAAYLIHGVDLRYHLNMMSLLGAWAVVSIVFQAALARGGTATLARFAWPAADIILLTTLLLLADGPVGPLLIGYPLLVVAAGLFFQIRLVWFMTAVALASFAALVLLRPEMRAPPQYAFIFAGTLAVVGWIVAHQVRRAQALMRYYETRRTP